MSIDSSSLHIANRIGALSPPLPPSFLPLSSLPAAKACVESVESELQQLSKEATALTARMGKAKRSVTAKVRNLGAG